MFEELLRSYHSWWMFQMKENTNDSISEFLKTDIFKEFIEKFKIVSIQIFKEHQEVMQDMERIFDNAIPEDKYNNALKEIVDKLLK